jgi:hypothetical protein
LVGLALQSACNKESQKQYCWKAYDLNGNIVADSTLCGKTKAEVEAEFLQFKFFRQYEETFCWQDKNEQGSDTYIRHFSPSLMEWFYPSGAYSYSKADCNSFCIWKWLQITQSKTTGLFNQTRIFIETYAADSCAKLFEGRRIIIREKADSIIYREFAEQSNP